MKSGEEQSSSSEEEPKLVGRRRRGNGKRSESASLMSALTEARRSVETVADDLRDRVEERPWQTLGLAVGAGYLLGGGLFTALTGRLLFGGVRIGLRLAAIPLVREELLGFVENIRDTGRGETERRQQ
jgi:ElaB/YqjD/DUF883 family membrane-anchored ribosome-binding protein